MKYVKEQADLVYRWKRSHNRLLIVNTLVDQLSWDYDRLSSGGKEVLDKLGKLFDNNQEDNNG
tara:strand:+ start:429 stop:617 length:189 start_codon:yes stop_codon:yes gene_type:complete